MSKAQNLLDQKHSVRLFNLQPQLCQNAKSLPFSSAVQGTTFTPNAAKLTPPLHTSYSINLHKLTKFCAAKPKAKQNSSDL